MPLVQPLPPDHDEEVRTLADFFDETLGFCPNSVLTTQRRPRIARAFIELNKAVMENRGRVTSALKRLVAYVPSEVAGCRYCQAHAIRAAERYGAADEQLAHVWEYRSHPSFDDAEARWFDDLQRMTASLQNAVRIRRAINVINVEHLLPRVKVPTLVLHCRDDATVPFEEGRRMAARIEGPASSPSTVATT